MGEEVAHDSTQVGDTGSKLKEHASVVAGHRIYVAGGTIGNGRNPDNIFILEYSAGGWVWRKCEMKIEEIRLSLHTMILIQDKVYCFPGISGRSLLMWTLDLVEEVAEQCDARRGELMPEGKAAGEYVEKLHMIVTFGGLRGPRVIDSLVGFDLRTETWSELTAKGSSPPPRYNHCSCMPGMEEILFFGGNETRALVPINTIYSLRCDSRVKFTWSQVVWNALPQARANATMNCIGQRIFVFGGYPDTNTNVSNELFVYDLDSEVGQAVNAQSPRAGGDVKLSSIKLVGTARGTTYHTAAIVGEKLVIVGGSGSAISGLQIFSPAF